MTPISLALLLLPNILFLSWGTAAAAFSRGKGLRASPSSDGAFVSFDRFRAACPADPSAIRQFDPSLVKDDAAPEEMWVAVYRSANNLPSVLIRDEFLSAMKASTTAQEGDSETLVSSPSAETSGVISNGNGSNDSSDSVSSVNNSKPVAVARLFKDANNIHILDSMRCVLKKENTDDNCDGGSEHAEAIGVCIDELVLIYLRRCLESEDSGAGGEQGDRMTFDRGLHFRGTLISGKLLDSRGFREVSELSPDMHSHESDFDGALAKYADRSMSKEIAKNIGARDRALNIVSYLVKIDRSEDQRRAQKQQGEVGDENKEKDEEEGFDPWSSVKKYI